MTEWRGIRRGKYMQPFKFGRRSSRSLRPSDRQQVKVEKIRRQESWLLELTSFPRMADGWIFKCNNSVSRRSREISTQLKSKDLPRFRKCPICLTTCINYLTSTRPINRGKIGYPEGRQERLQRQEIQWKSGDLIRPLKLWKQLRDQLRKLDNGWRLTVPPGFGIKGKSKHWV